MRKHIGGKNALHRSSPLSFPILVTLLLVVMLSVFFVVLIRLLFGNFVLDLVCRSRSNFSKSDILVFTSQGVPSRGCSQCCAPLLLLVLKKIYLLVLIFCYFCLSLWIEDVSCFFNLLSRGRVNRCGRLSFTTEK
jgi:hypothetical protein